MKHLLTKVSAFIPATALLLIAFGSASAQANIQVSFGAGFNDTTAATPVGGNNGTTVGDQRKIVFQTAAAIWGAALSSSQTITITASFTPLTCAANSGTLGAAGPTSSSAVSSSNQGIVPNRWYPIALAEALSNTNRNAASAEINAQFNSSVGGSNCLAGQSWYYGLDNNHGTNGIDLLTVLLHELGHGLGFLTFTNVSTGAFSGTAPNNFPSIWDDFLFDDTAAKSWSQMTTDQERANSAINTGNLVWIGPQVDADVPRAVLSGTPRLHVNSPASIGGNYQIFTADFGPGVTSGGTTGSVTQTIPNDGCAAITNSVAGKIAFIDRGTCTFITKTHNAQNAGAIGVIIADNAGNPNGPLTGLGGGPDNTITIPAVGISVADGNTIRAQLTSPGVNATLFSDNSRLAGTDTSGRPLMYAPSTVSSGSSVSHWDTTLFPNQLMEPNNSADVTHSVRTPQDLTLSLLRDIGWPINPNPPSTILIEQGTTNTASALDSVTFVKGPFTVLTSYNFAADGHRRLIIFTTPVLPANPTISVTANGIPLTVEAFGTFNALAGTSYIIVALPNLAGGGTTYALSVTVNGVSSTNTPTITIGP